MKFSLSLLLLAGMTPTGGEKPTYFENYAEAYQTAQESGQPMLVILNPAEDSERPPVSLADVQRSRRHRQLLDNYVVAVLDTGTEHGKTSHQLFGSPPLPRVAVIDRQQKHQIFRTSRDLSEQEWTSLLETYRTGVRRVSLQRSVSRPAASHQPPVSHSRPSQPYRPAFHFQQPAFCAT